MLDRYDLVVAWGLGVAALACSPAGPAPTAPTGPRASTTTAVAATGAGPTAGGPVATASMTGARIAALADGVLVIDADSGDLIRADRAGQPVASLPIGRGPGLLAVDDARGLAYVADRAGDRIVVVDIGRPGLAVRATWATAAEPYGVALMPDGATLLVAHIADRALVAHDSGTGAPAWRVALPAEPRAIAISPGGTRALITSVGSDGLTDVSLIAPHPTTTIAFDPLCDRCADGEAFTRGAAVTFLDERRAIASFQREVPEAIELFENAGRYGGTALTPITQHLAFLSFSPGAPTTQVVAQVVANQPRALLWDQAADTLFVAGLASDTLLRLRGLTGGTTDEIDDGAADFLLRPSEPCGPDGLARSAAGDFYLWCSFSRRVVRFAPAPEADPTRRGLEEGPALAASALSPTEHRGMVLFHAVDHSINRARAMACATCHLDGRTDGLSWKIRDLTLQTPLLAGRIGGTAPYKWDASAPTLAASIASTVSRLGGAGLAPADRDALIAYLATLPSPRPPTLDVAAVARGRQVFDDAGCAECHPAPRYTDGGQHRFDSVLEVADTPSLLGVGASGPYYHDGSATTLAGLLRGEGFVRGMAELYALTPAQRADLEVFLRSL